MKKALVTAIQREIRARVPQLGSPLLQLSGESVPMAIGLYQAELSESLRGYVLFQVHRKEDSFTIEVACTRNQRWPAFYLRSPRLLDELSEEGDIRFRLARFWGAEDHWWTVTPESARAAAGDAIERLRRYAIPYFGMMATKG